MNAEGKRSYLRGGEQTLNKTGYMVGSLDKCSKEFVEFSGASDGIAMDIGACYGIATLAALEGGAKKVIAVDNEPRHLEILRSRANKKDLDRLECVVGALPNNLEFAENSISAILCSRVLHLLQKDEVEESLKRMYDWLEKGGRVYLINDTPHVLLDDFLVGYEERKRRGDKWPGYIDDIRRCVHPDFHDMCPDYLTFTDVDELALACERGGFKIIKADLMERLDYPASLQSGGKENVAIVAVKE